MKNHCCLYPRWKFHIYNNFYSLKNKKICANINIGKDEALRPCQMTFRLFSLVALGVGRSGFFYARNCNPNMRKRNRNPQSCHLLSSNPIPDLLKIGSAAQASSSLTIIPQTQFPNKRLQTSFEKFFIVNFLRAESKLLAKGTLLC